MIYLNTYIALQNEEEDEKKGKNTYVYNVISHGHCFTNFLW